MTFQPSPPISHSILVVGDFLLRTLPFSTFQFNKLLNISHSPSCYKVFCATRSEFPQCLYTYMHFFHFVRPSLHCVWFTVPSFSSLIAPIPNSLPASSGLMALSSSLCSWTSISRLIRRMLHLWQQRRASRMVQTTAKSINEEPFGQCQWSFLGQTGTDKL